MNKTIWWGEGMVLTLEEVKLYLKVDGDEEDALIISFIQTAQEICEDILRYPLSDIDTIPLVVKQSMLYCIANMYEKREGTYNYLKNESSGIKETVDVMKTILSSYRKESW